jgi:spermidine/putrescine transport system ATP-binding protein
VEIYERPNCRFVADFIGESNFFSGIVKSLNHGFASVYVPILKTELRGMPAEGIVAGDNVIVSVRAEKVRASEQAALNENSFRGRIAKSVYIGSESHVIVDVNGTILKVWEQNKISTLEPGAYHTPGSEVWLTLFPENTLILRDE